MDQIKKCEEKDYPTLVDIWERSVRASHTFLSEKDITEFREAMIPVYFPNVDLYCIADRDTIAGFIGLSGNMIEMLFIDDSLRGKGYGSRLLKHAISLGAN